MPSLLITSFLLLYKITFIQGASWLSYHTNTIAHIKKKNKQIIPPNFHLKMYKKVKTQIILLPMTL